MTIEDLKAMSLGRVSELLTNGTITEELAKEYVQLWNTSAPRFTRAVVEVWRIAQYSNENNIID